MKEKIKQWIRYHALKRWFEKYERWVMPATLVLGVLADAITFTTIDITTSFLLLGVYFGIAGAMIAYQNAYDAGRIPKYDFWQYLRLSAPFAIQFTFGALLSGSFIFYFFSGTVFVSWPFIAILVILMVSNDVFRRYYLKSLVQLSVFFFILLSLVSIILPFVLHTLASWVFVFASAVSLVILFVYTLLLARIIPHIQRERGRLAALAFFIVASINSLYFFNIIPPIPLALRDAEVAHSVVRSGNSYTLGVEEESFWEGLWPHRTFHKALGEKVYMYTAIFAPADLITTIVHHWQYYDETQKQWLSRDRLTFPITGGTKRGYRGYSLKTVVEPGRWRVDVETARGQVLGRVNFRVLSRDQNIPLKTVVK